MVEQLIGQVVVVDFRSPFVCLGTLTRCDADFLELADADLHDFRDAEISRENYVFASAATGIKRNRVRVLIARRDIVAIARLDDVVDE